jgi:transposase
LPFIEEETPAASNQHISRHHASQERVGRLDFATPTGEGQEMSVYESELNINTGFVPTANGVEHQEQSTFPMQRPSYDRQSGMNDKAVHRRRRWTHEEKKAIVAETEGPGASISGVARKYGIAPRLLFSWRRQLSEEMALTTRSGAKIVPISMVRDLEKRIKELEDQLEKKSCELSKVLESSGTADHHR